MLGPSSASQSRDVCRGGVPHAPPLRYIFVTSRHSPDAPCVLPPTWYEVAAKWAERLFIIACTLGLIFVPGTRTSDNNGTAPSDEGLAPLLQLFAAWHCFRVVGCAIATTACGTLQRAHHHIDAAVKHQLGGAFELYYLALLTVTCWYASLNAHHGPHDITTLGLDATSHSETQRTEPLSNINEPWHLGTLLAAFLTWHVVRLLGIGLYRRAALAAAAARAAGRKCARRATRPSTRTVLRIGLKLIVCFVCITATYSECSGGRRFLRPSPAACRLFAAPPWLPCATRNERRAHRLAARRLRKKLRRINCRLSIAPPIERQYVRRKDTGGAFNPYGSEGPPVTKHRSAGTRKRPTPWFLEQRTRIDASSPCGDAQKRQDHFALSIEAINGSCWRTLQDQIKRAHSEALLLQEHRLACPKKLAAATRWCLNNGWKAVFSPAVESTEGGEPSGGVAILVRASLMGLAEAPEILEPTHRAIAAKVDFPGGRRTLLISTYFRHTIGLKDDNLTLLEQIGAATSLWAGPSIVGGDFNTTPATLAASGVDISMRAKIFAPAHPMGTCRKPTSNRVIDFFLVSNDIADGVESVETVELSGMSPHVPVKMAFLPKLASLCTRHLRKPQPLPTTPTVGPHWRARGWADLTRRLTQLKADLRQGRVTAAYALKYADGLLRLFADKAELEIEANTATEVKKHGTRCRGPDVHWKSIVREKIPLKERPLAAAKWAQAVARVILHQHGTPTAEQRTAWLSEVPSARADAASDAALTTLLKKVEECIASTDPGDAAATAAVAADTLEHLSTAADLLTSAEKWAGLKSWKEWLLDKADKGWRRAHTYTRLPETWKPEEVPDGKGGLSGDPIALFLAACGKLQTLWGATDCTSYQSACDNLQFSLLTDDTAPLNGTQLRTAARSFSPSTSSTYDGLHPRQFDSVSDEGLDALAALLNLVEDLGTWPPGIAAVVSTLIPKPKGGTRPIGLFSGIYRLWARSRLTVATAWERANDQPFFSAKEGKAALDTVWNQAFSAERTVACGKVAAAVLLDMRSFYENFSHERLQLRANGAGFPARITRLAIAAYRAPRLITQDGRVGPPVMPKRGVIAGCGFATTWVKVYCLQPFKEFCARHPRVKLDAYIDDLTLSASGDSDDEVALLLQAAAEDLYKVITELLECDLAKEKSAVVASSDSLAKLLSDKLGCLGTTPAAATASLGVDLAAGKQRRTHGKTSTRATRFRKGMSRKIRIATLRKTVGGRIASMVTNAGAIAATEYGASVNGISDTEWGKLQSIAAAGMTPAAHGRSLTALLALKGDPTARAATAPIAQWARMAWKAHLQQAGDVTLEDLAEAWTETCDERQTLISLEGIRQWQLARGPIAAMYLSLDRIGWHTDDGINLIDDMGISRSIVDTPPSLWRIHLDNAVQRLHERALGTRTGFTCLRGRRVCVEVVKRVAKSARIPSLGQCHLMAAACNSVWTKVRARLSGYVLEDTLCAMCGTEQDTLHHRLWHCNHPKVDAARRAAAPPSVIKAARAAGPCCPLYNRGLFEHPAHDLPPPATTGQPTMFSIHGEVTPENFALGGQIFIDGSADQYVIADLKRAGWGVVQVDSEGHVTAGVYGVVPACLPQTSQAAEFSGLLAATVLVTSQAHVHADCENVVKGWAKEDDFRSSGKQVYDGLLKAARSAAGAEHIDQVTWVKAHQSISAALNSGDARRLQLARGNDNADTAANKGRLLHPQLTTEAKQAIDLQVKQATAACRVIAATLPLWPRLERGQERVKIDRPKGWAAEAPQPAERHDWAKGDKHWHCLKCFKHAKGVTPNGLRSRQRCKGRPDCLAERHREFGHALWETTCAGVPLLLCTTCGAWCDRTPKGLGQHCVGHRTEAGSRACRRTFSEGFHPARDTLVDREPMIYHYDEEVHGPSCRTVSVRKLARQQLRRLVPWTEVACHPTPAPGDDPTPEEEQYWAQLSRDFLDGDSQEQPPADDWDQIEAPSGEDFSFFESLPELSPAAVRPPHLLANLALAADLCELHRIFAPSTSLVPEVDPDIAEFRDLLEQRTKAQQRHLQITDPDDCAQFWAEAMSPTSGVPNSAVPQHATASHTGDGREGLERPATLTRLQKATVRRNKASAYAKRQAKKAAARPQWNISNATGHAFQVTSTGGSDAPLEAWQQERALANKEFALAKKEDSDRALAPLFEALKTHELSAQPETVLQADGDIMADTEATAPPPFAASEATASGDTTAGEPVGPADETSECDTAAADPVECPAEAAATLLSEADLANLSELAEMAEQGEKVLWPRGYDPSDSRTAALATSAPAAAIPSEVRTARGLQGHDTSAAAPTLSDDELTALIDLVDMADLGDKVVWPLGLDRRTALSAIAAGTEARQRLATTPTHTAPPAERDPSQTNTAVAAVDCRLSATSPRTSNNNGSSSSSSNSSSAGSSVSLTDAPT